MPAFFRANGKKQFIQAHYTMSAAPRTDEEVRELAATATLSRHAPQ